MASLNMELVTDGEARRMWRVDESFIEQSVEMYTRRYSANIDTPEDVLPRMLEIATEQCESEARLRTDEPLIATNVSGWEKSSYYLVDEDGNQVGEEITILQGYVDVAYWPRLCSCANVLPEGASMAPCVLHGLSGEGA